MAIKYLDAKRIRGSSTALGSSEEIILDDNPSSQYSWGTGEGQYAPSTPTPSNHNNYNGVFINTNSVLKGKKLIKVKAWLCKVGSPNTSGTIRLGVMSGTGSGSTKTWVTDAYVDIQNLISGESTSGAVTLNTGFPATAVPIEITLPTPHTLAENDTIALGCTGGNYSNSNCVAWQYSDGNGVYDGSNTSRNRFTGGSDPDHSGGSWTGSGMASDMHCTLTCQPIVDEKTTLVTPAQLDGYGEFNSASDFAYGSGAASFKFLSDGSPFSMAFWIRRRGTQATQEPGVLDNNGGTAGNVGFDFYMGNESTTATQCFISNGTATTGSVTTTMADNTWYHFTVTHSGSGSGGTLTVYKDGVSVGTPIDTSSYSFSSSNPYTSLNIGRNPRSGYKITGDIADIGIWEDHVLSSGDITKLKDGQRITDDGTGFDYSSSNITTHVPLFTDTTDTKGSHSFTNSGISFAAGATTNPTASSATSDLAENTLFEETDTYKTYWLQDGEWKPTTPPILNMTYANSTLADAVWVSDGTRTTGEGIIKIDTTNNYLKDYWDSTTGTYRLSSNTYDLGSSLGTTWTVQFTVNFSNWRDPTSSNYVWGMGMWGSPSSSSMNTSQDRLALFVDNSSSYTRWNTSGATASGDGSMEALDDATGTTGSPSAVPSASTNSKDWFVTLQKVDATKYTVVVREDSHTGTIIGALKDKAWLAGTPSSFRYFGAKCTMSNSARTGMIIKDVLVYDGSLVGSI